MCNGAEMDEEEYYWAFGFDDCETDADEGVDRHYQAVIDTAINSALENISNLEDPRK